jgi:hypothetical protein
MCKHGMVAEVNLGGVVVGVDACIALLVQAINAAGIKTVASCCGHGHRPGTIALADGRELVIARDFAEAREIDGLFPYNIHGEIWDEAQNRWVAEASTVKARLS